VACRLEEEYDAQKKEKDQLTAVMRDCFSPLLDGSADSDEKTHLITTFKSAMEMFRIDQVLLIALPGIIEKPPAARAGFDIVTLQAFEAEIATRLSEYDKLLEEKAAEKAKNAEAVDHHFSLTMQAKSERAASLETLNAIQSRMSACEQASYEAELAVRALEPEREMAANACERAAEQLLAFRSGSLAAFFDLKERNSPWPLSEKSIHIAGNTGAIISADELPDLV